MGYDSDSYDLYSYRFYLISDGFQYQFGATMIVNIRLPVSRTCPSGPVICPCHFRGKNSTKNSIPGKERTVKPMIFCRLVWRCREKIIARRGSGAGFM